MAKYNKKVEQIKKKEPSTTTHVGLDLKKIKKFLPSYMTSGRWALPQKVFKKEEKEYQSVSTEEITPQSASIKETTPQSTDVVAPQTVFTEEVTPQSIFTGRVTPQSTEEVTPHPDFHCGNYEVGKNWHQSIYSEVIPQNEFTEEIIPQSIEGVLPPPDFHDYKIGKEKRQSTPSEELMRLTPIYTGKEHKLPLKKLFQPLPKNDESFLKSHKLKFKNVEKGDMVYVARKTKNRTHGWIDRMDAVIGHQAKVEHRSARTFNLSFLYPPNHKGIIYIFDILCLEPLNCETVDKNTLVTNIGNIRYHFNYGIEIGLLKSYALDEDYILLKNLFKDKKYIQINDGWMDKIKNTCPRIIGVLLSNGFMKKNKIKED